MRMQYLNYRLEIEYINFEEVDNLFSVYFALTSKRY